MLFVSYSPGDRKTTGESPTVISRIPPSRFMPTQHFDHTVETVITFDCCSPLPLASANGIFSGQRLALAAFLHITKCFTCGFP